MASYGYTCGGVYSHPIRSKIECDRAINALSSELHHIVNNVSIHKMEKNRLKGCHFDTGDKRVYWNEHPNHPNDYSFEDHYKQSRKICMKEGKSLYYHF